MKRGEKKTKTEIYRRPSRKQKQTKESPRQSTARQINAYFSDTDEQIWNQEQPELRHAENQKLRMSYAHPDEPNLQIPHANQRKIEHMYIDSQDPTPRSNAQKRREALGLGLF